MISMSGQAESIHHTILSVTANVTTGQSKNCTGTLMIICIVVWHEPLVQVLYGFCAVEE